MKIAKTIVLIIAFPAIIGCAGISGRLPAPAEPVASGEFNSGAAKVDITPIPGYPMGGYAIAGYISRGVWTRLYARAVSFEDPEGRSMVIVSADLWAMPAGLADRVAELVARKHGIERLSREQMILAATHTHNGPGNFSSSKFYNQMASLEGGFDRALFDFLADRIAWAIAESWKKREPAAVRYAQGQVPGIARNRSIGPFKKNGSDALELIESNKGLPVRKTDFPIGGDKAYMAIDQTLRMIKIQSATRGGELIAALAFYAVHPTVMNTTTRVYSSDIFGVATSIVENSLHAAGRGTPVVAMINGAEGDVAANWKRRDREETIEIGRLLSTGILDLIEGPGSDITGPIKYSFGESRLSELTGPASGASTLCGAEADWSFLRDAGFYEGMKQEDPERQMPGQWVKRNPLKDDIESNMIKSAYPWIVKNVMRPPASVPIGVYGIGPVTIATLPGEFTTVLGKRIAKAVARERSERGPVLLAGLANEYISYFCTREEYAEQHYEGASMIYGPSAGERIRDDLAGLAKTMDGKEPRLKSRKYRYSTGSGKSFGVKQFDLVSHQDRLKAFHYTLDGLLRGGENSLPVTDNPRFIWIDDNPRWSDYRSSKLSPMPAVAVEVLSPDGWKRLKVDGIDETDEGTDFVTAVVASLIDKTRWSTIWIPPASVESDPVLREAEYRFVVRGNTGLFISPPFTIESARAKSGLTGVARKPVERES
ncbi:MAG: neutral/alkaline non-lysosomal ceramidase N-terminal domain-containing protein [Candidatus Krumholzibacteriota bacterium]|nr:neutral/alkaline non-lysosomal ceramidase N-terminal domain-containing protein [Candidatus Krumholzibacteriota bacterium]